MRRLRNYDSIIKLLGGIVLLGFSQIVMADFQQGLFNAQQRLAELGDAKAQYKLGVMYENGRGVKRDVDKAISWMKKSSHQGYGLAKLRIRYTTILKSGTNPERDKNWLARVKQLTEKDNGYGLLISGLMYKNGVYVGKDLKHAAKLFSRASSKGMGEANIELYEIEKLVPASAEVSPQEKPVAKSKPVVKLKKSKSVAVIKKPVKPAVKKPVVKNTVPDIYYKADNSDVDESDDDDEIGSVVTGLCSGIKTNNPACK